MTPSDEMTARMAANLLLAELSMILDPDLGDDEVRAVRDKCQEAIEKARREENEACARVATEFHFDVDYVAADTAPLAIAAAIRARVKRDATS